MTSALEQREAVVSTSIRRAADGQHRERIRDVQQMTKLSSLGLRQCSRNKAAPSFKWAESAAELRLSSALLHASLVSGSPADDSHPASSAAATAVMPHLPAHPLFAAAEKRWCAVLWAHSPPFQSRLRLRLLDLHCSLLLWTRRG